MVKRGRYFKSPGLLIVSLVIINLLVILTAIRYFMVEKQAFVNQEIQRLHSIANIKVNQIIDWRNERLSDARYLYSNPRIAESYCKLLNNPRDQFIREAFRENLNGMFMNGKYESMLALDNYGKVIFSLPDMDSVQQFSFGHEKSQAGNSRKVIMGDFSLSRSGVPVMQISVPLLNIHNNDSSCTGIILLHINLEKDFLPLLRSIPIPSESTQATILFHEKETSNNPDNFISPDYDSPIIKKVKSWPTNHPGNLVEEGIDSHGIAVLAVLLPVPESKAFLLVKMNKKEAYAEVRKTKINITALAVLMVFALSFSISFFWLKQRNELLILEQEKKIILERFELFSKFSNDAIILYSKDLIILQVNDRALELYGYSKSEILGMNVESLRSPEKRNELQPMLETTIKENGCRYETIHIRKEGSEFPVEVSLRYMEMYGSPCFQALVRDITQRKQFERALLSSEEQLKLITNTLPQIVWTADADGTFDFVNSRLELLTGIDPIKSKSLEGFIHPNDHKRVVAYWKHAVNHIREHQIRFRIRMKDGEYRWFLCIAIPLCQIPDKVTKWYGSATDIDDLEKQVSQRTKELSDLYNNAPCGYFSMRPDGTFLQINDTALRWLGYKREEILEIRKFKELILAEVDKPLDRYFNHLSQNGFVNNVESNMIRKDGSLLPVLISASGVFGIDHELLLIRATIIDHTERKRHEDEIMKLNTILQEHGYNLEYSNKELEAFIFSVSHDLRAPLRAINGFSRILLDDYLDHMDDEAQKMLKTIADNATRMKHLIDDLLRLSRTGRQELSYSRINMQALFFSLMEEVRQQYTGRNISVTINPLPYADGDLALLKQVITNLLSNAVKFTGKKEIAELQIGFEIDEKEQIYFVHDNGTGFDMKYSHDLFGVFKRLNNADDFEGTGVGLALVKRIIDKHGGRVWANSEPDQGATFYFSLPIKTMA